MTPAQQYLKEIERLREEATQSARPWALHCALEDSQRAVGRVIRAAEVVSRADGMSVEGDEFWGDMDRLIEALDALRVEVDDV